MIERLCPKAWRIDLAVSKFHIPSLVGEGEEEEPIGTLGKLSVAWGSNRTEI